MARDSDTSEHAEIYDRLRDVESRTDSHILECTMFRKMIEGKLSEAEKARSAMRSDLLSQIKTIRGWIVAAVGSVIVGMASIILLLLQKGT